MRFRSLKTQRAYVQRRTLVAQLLADEPICQRCSSARSTEVHELLSRARGGSILDPKNCVALCSACHRHITQNPSIGRIEGWSRNSWEAKA